MRNANMSYDVFFLVYRTCEARLNPAPPTPPPAPPPPPPPPFGPGLRFFEAAVGPPPPGPPPPPGVAGGPPPLPAPELLPLRFRRLLAGLCDSKS